MIQFLKFKVVIFFFKHNNISINQSNDKRLYCKLSNKTKWKSRSQIPLFVAFKIGYSFFALVEWTQCAIVSILIVLKLLNHRTVLIEQTPNTIQGSTIEIYKETSQCESCNLNRLCSTRKYHVLASFDH